MPVTSHSTRMDAHMAGSVTTTSGRHRPTIGCRSAICSGIASASMSR